MTDNLKNWRIENKRRLYAKMQKLGIDQGGIFSDTQRNIDTFKQLTKELSK